MKIIGGHDFYDGAGWGIDTDILFLRKERLIPAGPFHIPRAICTRNGAATLSFFFALIGGEVFPGVREEHHFGYFCRKDKSRHQGSERLKHGRTVLFHYDVDAAQNALKELDPDADKRFDFLFRTGSDEIAAHFANPQRAERTDWMITEKVGTGIVERDDRRKVDPIHARVNCADLEEVEAYRACDPATAHMKISSWIGGVLPAGPQTVDLSDTDKIRKAGFDTRISFRQEPGVKKPRRRGKTGNSSLGNARKDR